MTTDETAFELHYLELSEIQTLGEQPGLILDLQRFTAPFDLTGSPTITLPGALTDTGLPIGIQLIAPQPRGSQADGRRNRVPEPHRVAPAPPGRLNRPCQIT